jgi:hypothetical protein
MAMKADKIVSLVKKQREEIMELYRNDNEKIDFLGCSLGYCEEKINYLIRTLQDYKKYLREINKIK